MIIFYAPSNGMLSVSGLGIFFPFLFILFRAKYQQSDEVYTLKALEEVEQMIPKPLIVIQTT